jgi:hypothetical protein
LAASKADPLTPGSGGLQSHAIGGLLDIVLRIDPPLLGNPSGSRAVFQPECCAEPEGVWSGELAASPAEVEKSIKMNAIEYNRRAGVTVRDRIMVFSSREFAS